MKEKEEVEQGYKHYQSNLSRKLIVSDSDPSHLDYFTAEAVKDPFLANREVKKKEAYFTEGSKIEAKIDESYKRSGSMSMISFSGGDERTLYHSNMIFNTSKSSIKCLMNHNPMTSHLNDTKFSELTSLAFQSNDKSLKEYSSNFQTEESTSQNLKSKSQFQKSTRVCSLMEESQKVGSLQRKLKNKKSKNIVIYESQTELYAETDREGRFEMTESSSRLRGEDLIWKGSEELEEFDTFRQFTQELSKEFDKTEVTSEDLRTSVSGENRYGEEDEWDEKKELYLSMVEENQILRDEEVSFFV